LFRCSGVSLFRCFVVSLFRSSLYRRFDWFWFWYQFENRFGQLNKGTAFLFLWEGLRTKSGAGVDVAVADEAGAFVDDGVFVVVVVAFVDVDGVFVLDDSLVG